MNRPENFEQRVSDVLRRLKAGEVVTYGEVAEEAGFPRAARAVGNLLAEGAEGAEGLPWWRVVRSDGTLAARHLREQVRRLESEGISVKEGRVAISTQSRRG